MCEFLKVWDKSADGLLGRFPKKRFRKDAKWVFVIIVIINHITLRLIKVL